MISKLSPWVRPILYHGALWGLTYYLLMVVFITYPEILPVIDKIYLKQESMVGRLIIALLPLSIMVVPFIPAYYSLRRTVLTFTRARHDKAVTSRQIAPRFGDDDVESA